MSPHSYDNGSGYNSHIKDSGLILEDGASVNLSDFDRERLRMPKAIFRRVRIRDFKRVRCFGYFGSRHDFLTVYFAGPSDDEVILTTGCFTGTLTEYAAEVSSKSTVSADERFTRTEQLELIDFIRFRASKYESEIGFELRRDSSKMKVDIDGS